MFHGSPNKKTFKDRPLPPMEKPDLTEYFKWYVGMYPAPSGQGHGVSFVFPQPSGFPQNIPQGCPPFSRPQPNGAFWNSPEYLERLEADEEFLRYMDFLSYMERRDDPRDLDNFYPLSPIY